ncbi:MAG: cytidylate kinase-like family protein [Verrucomicrobia bacterium]|nr:cytidylate kinase-like family protein [Verrucomicrobiota bacterium]
MVTLPKPPGVETAHAYLNVHLTHPGSPLAAHAVCPFVTISREAGTGGTILAHALAARLPARFEHPWTVYSSNLIEEMLRTNNLPPHLARFLPEDRVSELDASVGEVVGLHPNLWMLVAKANELIRRLARAGQAILLGRGANFATLDLPHGIHVRLIAPASYRDARVARLLEIDPAEASTRNAECDAARRRYVRSTFNADVADPTAYDLMINVAHVPVETVVDLVASCVMEHERHPATFTAR